jgi:hypothetical protein
LFDAFYPYDNGLAFIGTLLMLFGVGIAVLKVFLAMAIGIGKAVTLNGKTVLAGILIVICFACSAFGTVQYIRYLVDDSSSSLSKSDAIGIAKNSIMVENKIKDLWSWSNESLTYSSSTATKQSDGDWEVVLRGTISGYDYIYNSDSFMATVYISERGSIQNVRVSTY